MFVLNETVWICFHGAERNILEFALKLFWNCFCFELKFCFIFVLSYNHISIPWIMSLFFLLSILSSSSVWRFVHASSWCFASKLGLPASSGGEHNLLEVALCTMLISPQFLVPAILVLWIDCQLLSQCSGTTHRVFQLGFVDEWNGYFLKKTALQILSQKYHRWHAVSPRQKTIFTTYPATYSVWLLYVLQVTAQLISGMIFEWSGRISAPASIVSLDNSLLYKFLE